MSSLPTYAFKFHDIKKLPMYDEFVKESSLYYSQEETEDRFISLLLPALDRSAESHCEYVHFTTNLGCEIAFNRLMLSLEGVTFKKKRGRPSSAYLDAASRLRDFAKCPRESNEFCALLEDPEFHERFSYDKFNEAVSMLTAVRVYAPERRPRRVPRKPKADDSSDEDASTQTD